MSRSGGLLELVARGKKDVFFIANPSHAFFHSVYRPAAAFTKEVYCIKPKNVPEWGRWCEFEFEHRGDSVRDVYLRMVLPTWLPADLVTVNNAGLITDLSGNTFGYCNRVGFQAIEKVQVFMNQVLLQELYGEALDWGLRQAYSSEQVLVHAAPVGERTDTPIEIARTASPHMLRVPLPLLGTQQDAGGPGFPTVALRGVVLRIRVWLRRLEEVVVCSDRRIAPAPWDGMPLRVQSTRNGPTTTDRVTRPYSELKQVDVTLETTQIYLPADVQTWLKAQRIRIPFRTHQFRAFPLDDTQLTAAALTPAVPFQVRLPLDVLGPADRILMAIRGDGCTQAGERTKYTGPLLTPYITSARLTIAGTDRVRVWSAETFREFAAYWKCARFLTDEVYVLSFGAGAGTDTPKRPLGTLQFTRASEPTLLLTLAPTKYDARIVSRAAVALVYTEPWNVFETLGDGTGRLMFDD